MNKWTHNFRLSSKQNFFQVLPLFLLLSFLMNTSSGNGPDLQPASSSWFSRWMSCSCWWREKVRKEGGLAWFKFWQKYRGFNGYQQQQHQSDLSRYSGTTLWWWKKPYICCCCYKKKYSPLSSHSFSPLLAFIWPGRTTTRWNGTRKLDIRFNSLKHYLKGLHVLRYQTMCPLRWKWYEMALIIGFFQLHHSFFEVLARIPYSL